DPPGSGPCRVNVGGHAERRKRHKYHRLCPILLRRYAGRGRSLIRSGKRFSSARLDTLALRLSFRQRIKPPRSDGRSASSNTRKSIAAGSRQKSPELLPRKLPSAQRSSGKRAVGGAAEQPSVRLSGKPPNARPRRSSQSSRQPPS